MAQRNKTQNPLLSRQKKNRDEENKEEVNWYTQQVQKRKGKMAGNATNQTQSNISLTNSVNDISFEGKPTSNEAQRTKSAIADRLKQLQKQKEELIKKREESMSKLNQISKEQLKSPFVTIKQTIPRIKMENIRPPPSRE